MRSEESKKNIKLNTTRVILNIPNSLNESYKILASRRGISKTSMIIYAMSWFLDYSKSIDIIPKMLQTLNNYDAEEIRALQNIKYDEE